MSAVQTLKKVLGRYYYYYYYYTNDEVSNLRALRIATEFLLQIYKTVVLNMFLGCSLNYIENILGNQKNNFMYFFSFFLCFLKC